MQTTQTLPGQLAGTRAASRTMQAIAALLLGLFIVGVVGFAQIDVVHNAAHDARHSNAFPCH